MRSCDMLESLQAGGVVTTVHIPILGFDAALDVSTCESSLNLPMTVETLELPVETVFENEDIQTIQIGECTALTSAGVNNSLQPMIIASTDSQGNCFVTLQDEQAFHSCNSWGIEKDVVNKAVPEASRAKTDVRPVASVSEVPTITKVANTRHTVGTRSYMRCGRSRMIADHLTSIPVSEFKSQLNDTSDIIGKLDLAPPTKKRMNLLQWKGIGKLFASPGQRIMSAKLMKIFTRHLRTRLLPAEETFTDMKLLPIGYKPEVDPTKIKRITRRRRYPEAEEYQRRMIQEQMQQSFQNLVADGQTQIQTVYVDSPEVFKTDAQETIQVLIEPADSCLYQQNESSRVVGVYGSDHVNDSSIIVIHNGQEGNQGSAYTQQNLEVLLAAASGENGFAGDNFHQVIICNSENSPEAVLPCASSIIIVPNDPLSDTITETVVST